MTNVAVGSLTLLLAGFAPWIAIKMVHFAGDSFHAVHAQAATAASGARSVVAAPQKVASTAQRSPAFAGAGGSSGGAGIRDGDRGAGEVGSADRRREFRAPVLGPAGRRRRSRWRVDRCCGGGGAGGRWGGRGGQVRHVDSPHRGTARGRGDRTAADGQPVSAA